MDQLTTNKLIDKLKKENRDKPVMLEGYPEYENGIARFYYDFSMKQWIEFPQEAIVHVVSAPENVAQATMVLVDSSAEIRFVNAMKAGELSSLPDPTEEPCAVFQQQDKTVVEPPTIHGGGGLLGCAVFAGKAGAAAKKNCLAGGFSESFCQDAAKGTAKLAYSQCRGSKA